MIRALFEAAADVFRFNFRHGTHDEHLARYDIVRAIEAETGRPIAVLADLQGPAPKDSENDGGCTQKERPPALPQAAQV
jgi:pyruvate kinase